MRTIARWFVGYLICGTILTFVAVGVSLMLENRPAAQAAPVQASAAEKRLGELQAEQRDQDDRVAKCMPAGAENLRPKDYSAMLDACERDNPAFDARISEQVDRQIADARSRVVDQQDKDRAAERQQRQAVADDTVPEESKTPRPQSTQQP